MTEVGLERELLDLQPCQYGYSRLSFRGPGPQTAEAYLAFIGGSETMGPFLTKPFPILVSEELGMGCANLGIKNAGPDVFLREPEVLRVAQRAAAVVLELPSVRNLSNTFYRVHPRRNDRFTRPEPVLLRKAPGIDLTQVHYTGHLLQTLKRNFPEAHAEVVRELRRAWIGRMRALISAVQVPVHLLSFDGIKPAVTTAPLIEPAMIAAIEAGCTSVTQVTPSAKAKERVTDEMFFEEPQARVARHMLSATAHREAAAALAATIRAGDGMKKARAG